MVIQFLDALAGAGKTRTLSRYAIRLAKAGELVLFVQPSRQLIDATVRDEFGADQRGFSIRGIHGGNCTDVVQTIIQNMKACRLGEGSVLFITHEAFMRLPYIENRRHWHLIFDEVPTVDATDRFNLPETHRMITTALRLEPYDAAYGKIVPDDDATVPLKQLARNPRGDDVWGLFKNLASRVLSPHWDVFALQSNYRDLLRGERDTHQLVTHSLLKPSLFFGFKQVIVASALFTESMLYKLWTAQGVALTPVAGRMLEELRYQQHSNGSAVTIRYIIDRHWSKSLRDKAFCLEGEDVSRSLGDRLPALILDTLSSERFAWMGNTDLPDDYFGIPEAVRLPNSPHGLNGFQQLHNVVVLSALNATPAHFRFMEMRGISADELHTASYRTAVYQAAMRISIRNPVDETPKSIIVMDAGTAHWLAELLPGSRIEEQSSSQFVIPVSPVGRPRRHASDADRVRAHRRKKRHLALLGSHCHGGAGVALSFGTTYASIYDTDPLLYLNAETVEAFIALLREAHDRAISSKQDNFLMSPAHFIPDAPDPDALGCETRRGLANIQHVNGIWLDNDGGDLSPEEFSRLLPQLRMVMWNTYSSTPKCLRWRCFIPTTAVMGVEDYDCIVRQIAMLLRHSGFRSVQEIAERPLGTVRRHGFDIGKFNAAALFYAPCQAAEPAHSFFIDYCDTHRAPLDVVEWLKNDVAALAARKDCNSITDEFRWNGGSSLQTTEKISDTNSAITRWRNTPQGRGHFSFYRLAHDLRRSGMPPEVARSRLTVEARHAKSPRERTSEIPDLVKRVWGR